MHTAILISYFNGDLMSNRNPSIDGLSAKQVEMLDILWSMDSSEEVKEFIAGLDEEEQIEYLVLSEMLVISIIDSVVNKLDEMPDVSSVLKRVM